jgi:uncharacterized protein YbjT (DUF2867 family)
MILVTGATGLSGSIVMRELARQDVAARALVRTPSKASLLGALPRAEIVIGDMSKPDTLGTALAGIKRVLMISSADHRMVETQCTFIDACLQAGVQHVIKFSGAEPDFDPQKFLFTRMHEEIERYLERSGLGWTHLRPSQFMQVYLREAPSITADNAFRLPLADIQLAPIDLLDVARIATALLRDGGHEGRSFDMTGPEALTMSDIADRLSQATGRTIRYVAIPLEERHKMLLAQGIPSYFVDALDDQTRERLKRKETRTCLEAHRAFGIEPTNFADFARRHAAVFGAAD